MKNEISIKDIVLATPKNADLIQLAESLENKPTELRLPIKATSNGDKYTYGVLLRKDNYGTGKIVLRLEGTPGQWYLETLLNRESRGDRDYIAIDFGQNWLWTNPKEVLEVAKEYADQLKESSEETDENDQDICVNDQCISDWAKDFFENKVFQAKIEQLKTEILPEDYEDVLVDAALDFFYINFEEELGQFDKDYPLPEGQSNSVTDKIRDEVVELLLKKLELKESGEIAPKKLSMKQYIDQELLDSPTADVGSIRMRYRSLKAQGKTPTAEGPVAKWPPVAAKNSKAPKCEKCGGKVPEDNDTGFGPALCDNCIAGEEEEAGLGEAHELSEFNKLSKEKQEELAGVAEKIYDSEEFQTEFERVTHNHPYYDSKYEGQQADHEADITERMLGITLNLLADYADTLSESEYNIVQSLIAEMILEGI